MLRHLRHPVAVGALALLALGSSPLAGVASARTVVQGSMTVSSGDRPADPEKWWGVAGAALCGWGIRLIRVAPEIGMNPYLLAATIGGCVLAIMDQV